MIFFIQTESPYSLRIHLHALFGDGRADIPRFAFLHSPYREFCILRFVRRIKEY